MTKPVAGFIFKLKHKDEPNKQLKTIGKPTREEEKNIKVEKNAPQEKISVANKDVKRLPIRNIKDKRASFKKFMDFNPINKEDLKPLFKFTVKGVTKLKQSEVKFKSNQSEVKSKSNQSEVKSDVLQDKKKKIFPEESIRCDDIDSNFFADTSLKDIVVEDIVNKQNTVSEKNTVENLQEENSPKKRKSININIPNKNAEKKICTEQITNKRSRLHHPKPEYIKISPLKYHMLLDPTENIDTNINLLLQMSMDYLSVKEPSIKNQKPIKIQLTDTINEQMQELDVEIEKIKEEITKWQDVREEHLSEMLKVGTSLELLNKPDNSTQPEFVNKTSLENITELEIISNMPELDCDQEFDKENQESNIISKNQDDQKSRINKITKLSTFIHKYVHFVSSECQNIYNKMFVMVKGKQVDPMLVLKTMAGLKKIDLN